MSRTDIEMAKTDGLFWDWKIPSLNRVSSDETRSRDLSAAILKALDAWILEGLEEEVRVRVEWPEKADRSTVERTVGSEICFTRAALTDHTSSRALMVLGPVLALEDARAEIDA